MTTTPSQRTTPLHQVHEQAGASFTDFGGWLMPLKYGSELAEHQAVRTSAGLFDLSHMGEVRVSGPEAAAALDYALVGKISAVKPGKAKYSLVCTEAGTVLDDVIVYRLDAAEPDADGVVDPGTEFLVVPNAGNASAVAAALSERASQFEATVTDESAQSALVAVQGPEAARILTGALVESAAVEIVEMKYYSALESTVRTEQGEVPVLVARTGYTGEDGFELIIGPEPDAEQLSAQATAVWNALVSAAEQCGADLLPCGLASRDSLRLEAGMPLYGNELDLEHLPAESGVGPVVAYKKEGDFVGRASLEAARERAETEAAEGTDTRQVLVGLQGEGRRAARSGYPVLDGDGAVVGKVTSGAPSPTLGHPVALARVDARHSAVGTALQVDLRGRPEAFTVVELPFYQRER
ncbi:glycine cleavage system aminomethyltransferase GcvT [Micrococcus terreus]|uniref:Aminomethyltransferase n=1 Tax=Micrococcus terreus TaxID=574650 RepID=A0A1I7MN73_9MICC|nr:glycine cleavage system aminomethyltransferase GcvT [Micrococcus terreus]SFV23381.1 aminomethyltransferase [Micrococcus terreus]